MKFAECAVVPSLRIVSPRRCASVVHRNAPGQPNLTVHGHVLQVPIQAMIGVKSIASEVIAPYRKDVLAKCYGGDISRKKKLLQKQADGKKRMWVHVFSRTLRRGDSGERYLSTRAHTMVLICRGRCPMALNTIAAVAEVEKQSGRSFRQFVYW